MRHLAVLAALAAALALAPAAAPGGWASVGFEPLPDGTSAGGTWSPTIFVKQHGVTPLTGLQPVVEISDETGAVTKFPAVESPTAGVYDARVVFPSEGRWNVTIRSGFGDSHVTYGPVEIGAPRVGGESRELPVVGGVVAVILAALGAVAFALTRRSRRLSPAS